MFPLTIIALTFCGLALLINILIYIDSTTDNDERLILTPATIGLTLAIVVFSLMLGRF